ncbi:hypothetical protein [Amphritea balenae]|uniref:Uncharacterized protein n=1 Tax=Amphritea balenae TaxID=452629 RepID=A0A3P1SML4_9GAMM|nr:hypothetical protein [Amphritea balenae]RRC97502.1 hypothetical protein EHS89_16830 [Amphritea balenae]GGK74568.1 hypothetical protein GCM10007941_25820 [Amphritea balenae]
MHQISYGDYRITAMVRPVGRNRWLLVPKIYHKDLKDTIFHNAGELEQVPENQVMANTEEEAIKQCFELGKLVIDADLH